MNYGYYLIASSMAIFFLVGWVYRKRPDPGLVKYNMETGKVSKPETMNIKNGRAVCPDCGSTALLGGPGGGMSQNVACDDCLAEFNIIPGNPPIILDHMGKLSVQRAQIYGISLEEWKEKSGDSQDTTGH